ncbi:hypothetical protein DRJ54_01965 [Candidatus Acetothermia bacterium]|nr:MAG: hypothetical protein DRJ54_01965 [Candidatus Acetothermia bacterium]
MALGISLGSGGARGYAHIGVLKALEEAGIAPALINGSSIGAIVGGAYALYRDTDKLVKLAKALADQVNLRYFNLFRYSMGARAFLQNWLLHAACDISALRISIYSHRRNLKALDYLFKDHSFSDTQIPFSAVAVDLLSGEVISVKEGPLVKGVLASISIPGIFPPVERDGRLLVDGGVLADVPVRELKAEGAEFVIAVKLEGEDYIPIMRSGLSLLTYVDFLKGEALSEWELEAADFVIRVDLSGLDIMEFGSYPKAIARGYDATRRILPKLRRVLGS